MTWPLRSQFNIEIVFLMSSARRPGIIAYVALWLFPTPQYTHVYMYDNTAGKRRQRFAYPATSVTPKSQISRHQTIQQTNRSAFAISLVTNFQKFVRLHTNHWIRSTMDWEILSFIFNYADFVCVCGMGGGGWMVGWLHEPKLTNWEVESLKRYETVLVVWISPNLLKWVPNWGSSTRLICICIHIYKYEYIATENERLLIERNVHIFGHQYIRPNA